MSYAIIVGIDPGIAGAVAWLRRSGDGVELLHVEDMPLNQLRGVSGPLLASAFNDWRPTLVFVESVHSMPKQGVKSTFTFGVGFGKVLGVLEAAGWPHALVQPQAWKKTQLAGTKKEKADAVVVACALWPSQARFFQTKNKARNAARAEAALIARHGIGTAAW